MFANIDIFDGSNDDNVDNSNNYDDDDETESRRRRRLAKSQRHAARRLDLQRIFGSQDAAATAAEKTRYDWPGDDGTRERDDERLTSSGGGDGADAKGERHF